MALVELEKYMEAKRIFQMGRQKALKTDETLVTQFETWIYKCDSELSSGFLRVERERVCVCV